MHIITKKVTLLPAPFVGTRVRIRVPHSPDAGLTFKILSATRADDCESFEVDWGDGQKEERGGMMSYGHTYAAAGEYEIKISDGVKSLGLSTPTNAYPSQYVPSVLSVVTKATRLTNFHCFRGCRNMHTFDMVESAVNTLASYAFVDCASLLGNIYLPRINDLPTTNRLPFAGCTGGITRIHFSAEHESAIRNSAAFLADPTLGTGVEGVCRFDL